MEVWSKRVRTRLPASRHPYWETFDRAPDLATCRLELQRPAPGCVRIPLQPLLSQFLLQKLYANFDTTYVFYDRNYPAQRQ